MRGAMMTPTFERNPSRVYAVKVLQDANQNGNFDFGAPG